MYSWIWLASILFDYFCITVHKADWLVILFLEPDEKTTCPGFAVTPQIVRILL